jgi:hypothetical protein
VENRNNDHAENRAILQRHISAIILPEAVDPSYEIYLQELQKAWQPKKERKKNNKR